MDDEGICVTTDECGGEEANEEGDAIRLVCEGDKKPGEQEDQIPCESNTDCMDNGIAVSCGEAILDGERVENTTKMCIEEALCTM